jgi:hypothetical protein
MASTSLNSLSKTMPDFTFFKFFTMFLGIGFSHTSTVLFDKELSWLSSSHLKPRDYFLCHLIHKIFQKNACMHMLPPTHTHTHAHARTRTHTHTLTCAHTNKHRHTWGSENTQFVKKLDVFLQQPWPRFNTVLY